MSPHLHVIFLFYPRQYPIEMTNIFRVLFPENAPDNLIFSLQRGEYAMQLHITS